MTPSLPSPWRLVLWPAAVTLAVTLLRLAGERLDGPAALFNREAGGGGALVGIIWLVPVFGFWFGRRLAAAEMRPARLGRALGLDVLAVAVLVAFLAVGFSRPTASASQFLAIGGGSWLAIAVAWRSWPSLAGVLLRYGLLARLPVVAVVLLGILFDWRTHYDVPPPGLPDLAPFARWMAIGVIPQLTLWMAVTVIGGLAFGLLAAAVAGLRGPAPQAVRA